ncbi:MAG: hypothetical protein MUC41_10505 [Syntrophobacteraceae bacterium]|nr:hypothetical protein [Syntrophobacteraceae bacterium]
MKRTISYVIVPIVIITFFGICLAREEKILSTKNEYNGKTIEEIYDENEEQYKDGFMRQIIFYDKRGNIKQIQSFYTEDQSSQDGVYSREQFYEHRILRRPRLIKSSFNYTDIYSNTHGLTKAEIHYDENGNKNKEELWYSDAFAARRNYSKLEVFYNRGGPEKRVYYDQGGSVILSEEKKQVWTSD